MKSGSSTKTRPRILLTGACGALGSAIREESKGQFDLVCMDLNPGNTPEIHRGTFTDAVLMRKLLEGCDAVIHTAALHGGHKQTHTPTQFMEVNVGGLTTMLELCREFGVKRFVFSSTMEVLIGIDWTASGMAVVDESSMPNPDWAYPMSKRLGEKLGLHYHRRYGIEFVAMRYMAFYVGMTPAKYLLAREVMTHDVAGANLLAATHPHLGYEIFNIGPDTPLTQQDIVQAVADPYPIVEKYWAGSSAVLKANKIDLKADDFWPVTRIDHAKRVLGWKPQVTFETYLQSLGWKKARS